MTEDHAKGTLGDSFWALGRRYGDRPALVSGARSLSYAELAETGGRIANALAARGLKAGDHIALAYRDGLELMAANVGVWMLDAVAVVVDFRNRSDERARLAEEFDIAAFLEDRDLSAGAYRSIPLDAAWRAEVAAAPATPRPLDGPEVPAYIALTSGTTGRPLGILMDHRALLIRCMAYALQSNYPREHPVFLNAYPLAFSASRNHALAHLLCGGTIHFHPPTFGPMELAERVNEIGASFLFAVPATVKAILDALPEGFEGPLLPTLTMLYCGGSGMMPADKVRAARLLTPHFLHCFASSITGTSAVLEGADILTHSESDGRIVPLARLEVVGPDHMPLPAGEVGMLRARTHGMSPGLYKNRARDTGDKIRDGWAYTGDMARISADGFLTITGRSSDVIVRGGANVFPAEIEAALALHPAVSESAVTGFADPEVEEEIAAFVVASAPVSEAELVAHCRLQLSPDKRPRKFVFLDSLPRNANGKVLKRDLRASLETGQG